MLMTHKQVINRTTRARMVLTVFVPIVNNYFFNTFCVLPSAVVTMLRPFTS